MSFLFPSLRDKKKAITFLAFLKAKNRTGKITGVVVLEQAMIPILVYAGSCAQSSVCIGFYEKRKQILADGKNLMQCFYYHPNKDFFFLNPSRLHTNSIFSFLRFC